MIGCHIYIGAFMKKIILLQLSLFLTCLLFAVDGNAQITAKGRTVFGQNLRSINPHNGHVRCVSDEYEASLQKSNPKRLNNEQFEQWIAPLVAKEKAAMASRGTDGTNVVITIPVVVHVIHNNLAVGTNANISEARVLSQITVLNQDFRKMLGTPGYNTNPVGADVEIEFALARRKPDGTATNGIDRVSRTTTNWSTESSVQAMKAATQWDPSKYLNIWTVQFTSNLNAEMGGVLGYAQFPSSSQLEGLDENEGAANTDGVVIDWRCFGSVAIASGTYSDDYDRGRTTTHEVAHYFGLRHIWGDAGNRDEGIDCSGTDYCNDTPTAGWENYDCAQVYNSCPAPGNDMVENYMDYTNDTCMNIFTLDQKARIQTVLLNSPRRNTLATSDALQAPLGIASFGILEGIQLFPNPANEVLNISVSKNGQLPDSYVIYNTLGQVLAASKISTAIDLKINTSNFTAGIYLIKLIKDNQSKTVQFIKK